MNEKMKPSEKAMAAGSQDPRYARVGQPGPLGRSELALLMLQWESTLAKLVEIEDQISRAVLDLQETVIVGNIKARYSKGRNKYDYETPCRASDRYLTEAPNYSTEVPEEITPAYVKTDWPALAKCLGVSPLIVQPGTPSVTIEILGFAKNRGEK